MWNPFKRKPKVMEDAEKIVETDEAYFMREYKIVNSLLKDAHNISHGIHNLALGKRNLKTFKGMISKLKKLENKERWQQMRVRYPKLKGAMDRLLEQLPFDQVTKNRIGLLLRQEHVFENDLLKRTVEELGPYLNAKKMHEIEWGVVEKTIGTLKNDLQALTMVINDLKRAIEGKS